MSFSLDRHDICVAARVYKAKLWDRQGITPKGSLKKNLERAFRVDKK